MTPDAVVVRAVVVALVAGDKVRAAAAVGSAAVWAGVGDVPAVARPAAPVRAKTWRRAAPSCRKCSRCLRA